jgi:hypothetical protein
MGFLLCVSLVVVSTFFSSFGGTAFSAFFLSSSLFGVCLDLASDLG